MDVAAPSNLAIACRSLRKVYDGKVEAVKSLDLEVKRGECFGLLGPNGAGKTTTIEILEGLLEPSGGDVEILGCRWGRDDEAIRRRVGISLQETRLTEKLTVRETVRLFRSFYAAGPDPDAVIEDVSLTPKADTWVGKLSGGQRQRLAIACALVGEPELLFLDEPTTGLDPRSRRDVWALVREFLEQGHTVLLTTHYMDEAERLCDRVAIVDHGEIIAAGTPRELISMLGGEHIIEFALAENGVEGLADLFEALTSVKAVREEAGGVSLTVDEPHVAIPELLNLVSEQSLELARLTTRHASLEDVFVTLTGRHLSEADE